MALSTVDSLLICVLWCSSGTTRRHVCFVDLYEKLGNASWSLSIERLMAEGCRYLLCGAKLFGVKSNLGEKSAREGSFCMLPCSAGCEKEVALSCKA